MEHRRFPGNSHWYHETQSCTGTALTLVGDPIVHEKPFLLDLPYVMPVKQRNAFLIADNLAMLLFPARLETSLTHTLSLYDRLSTALTVAQVAGVQRLCNHYAMRLHPLCSSDSSRESNNRLTQMTQYARQLAMQPSLIDDAAIAALDEVGLTEPDIVTLSQIVGFISYQARVIAGLQALQGMPVRWLPGITAAPDAEALSADGFCTLKAVEPGYATHKQHQAVKIAEPLLLTSSLVWRLAHNAQVLHDWSALHRSLPEGERDTALMVAVSARINGNAQGLKRYAGELVNALWLDIDSVLRCASEEEKNLVQAAAQLTRLPATFSAAHLQPLIASGYTASALVNLIQHCALANWDDRLFLSFRC